MKSYLRIIILSVATFSAQAQSGVGINTTQPDASAALEIQSTTQGILIPRMTASERGLISSPATGLLIYQTDASAGFYFYNGTSWTTLNTPATSDASQLTSGTLSDARLSSAVTVQGNTFNGAEQLVQLTGSAQLPAISGANLTGLTAGNLTGTVAVANGGTGASTAANARTNLELGTLAVLNTVGSSEITDGSVSNADLANTAALSVKGNATNAAASPSDIPAGTDGHVLRRSGTSLGFGQVATGGISDNAVTIAKLPPGATNATYLRGDGTWAAPAASGGSGTFSVTAENPADINPGTTITDFGSFTVSGLYSIISVTIDGSTQGGAKWGFITSASNEVIASSTTGTSSADVHQYVTINTVLGPGTYKIRVAALNNNPIFSSYAIRRVDF